MSEHYPRHTVSENCAMCDGSGWRLAMIDGHGDRRMTRCECRKRSRRARPVKRSTITLGPRICVNCLLENCAACDRDGCICVCVVAMESQNRETGRLFP